MASNTGRHGRCPEVHSAGSAPTSTSWPVLRRIEGEARPATADEQAVLATGRAGERCPRCPTRPTRARPDRGRGDIGRDHPLAFESRSVLEPGSGSGNFIGTAPLRAGWWASSATHRCGRSNAEVRGGNRRPAVHRLALTLPPQRLGLSPPRVPSKAMQLLDPSRCTSPAVVGKQLAPEARTTGREAGPPRRHRVELRSGTRQLAQLSGPERSSAVQLIVEQAGPVKTTALHIVLSCTSRKRTGANSYPRLSEVVANDVESRARAWISKLDGTPSTHSVRELYAGEYWRAGLDLAERASLLLPTSTWVLSAGLGLISLNDVVPAYGATLASGHKDSVVRVTDERSAREVRRKWWSELAAWRGPVGPSRPRLVSDLARDRSATIVVCAGRDYLSAVAPDLVEASVALDPGQMLVFGSGPPETGLASAWVQVPGQLRIRFGGTMSSTGVRVASAMVAEIERSGGLHGDEARRRVASWSAATSPLPRFERKRLSDRDIELWITSDLEAHPGSMNKSAALRRLRDDGLACEQARFGRLHDRASEAVR